MFLQPWVMDMFPIREFKSPNVIVSSRLMILFSVFIQAGGIDSDFVSICLLPPFFRSIWLSILLVATYFAQLKYKVTK